MINGPFKAQLLALLTSGNTCVFGDNGLRNTVDGEIISLLIVYHYLRGDPSDRIESNKLGKFIQHN